MLMKLISEYNDTSYKKGEMNILLKESDII